MGLRAFDLHDTSREVAVCSSCQTASCWQGIWRCDSPSRTAAFRTVRELATLDLEHPDYWEEQP